MTFRPPARWPLLAALALGAALVQCTSAFLSESVTSPNAAAAIAGNLVEGRGYQVFASDGGGAVPPRPGFRAYHLPGEVFFLALGFRTLPPALHRYLHVPVVVLLIVAAAAIAWRLGGRSAAIVAAAVLCADPFLVVHGPVWDDALLAAALQWSAIWMIAGTSKGHSTSWRLCAIGLLAAFAALTRAEAQVTLITIGGGLWLWHRRPEVRRGGLTLVAAVAIAMSGWAIRNALAIGVPMLGTTHDAKTLFESTFSTARGTIRRTGVAQEFDISQLPSSFGTLGWLDEVDADALFRREAWRYIAAHPGDVAITGAFKAAISVFGIQANLPLSSLRNVVPIVFNGVLLVAAAIGIRSWRRDATGDDRRVFFVVAASVSTWTLAGLMLGPVGLRYRMTFGVLVAIGAALIARERPAET
ncbi:MAG TPA: hypothetical protein VFO19_02605 [Vicinamibacterales bacterium]|nr:hypothetical protein [Vicinamibacterales bacterium]